MTADKKSADRDQKDRGLGELAGDILRELPRAARKIAERRLFGAARNVAAAFGLDLRTRELAHIEASLATEQADQLDQLTKRIRLETSARLLAEQKLQAVTQFLNPQPRAAQEDRKA